MGRRERHHNLDPVLSGNSGGYKELEYCRPKEFADVRDLPIEVAERSEIRATIGAAIASLPEIYREAFVLRDIAHVRMAEVAQILDISIPAAKARLQRARLMMCDTLTPFFATPMCSAWICGRGGNPWFRAGQ